MSELSVMISKEIFINVCISIEGLCANLYHYYSDIYVDIPEAARFWKKAALEEENHQKQFELALRLVQMTEIEVSKHNLKRVYGIQNNLLKLLEQSKQNRPELLVAVSNALELEEILAELHAHNALHFMDESMQNLFKALSDADRDHVADMQRYRNVLHQPLCLFAE